MKTLDSPEAYKLWNTYWQDMKNEWFKIEVLQDYAGEDECLSLRAWLDGDKQTSLNLLPQDTLTWGDQLRQKRNQHVLMRRVRIIEKPYTPYTEWEFECYKHNNIPNGEQILIIDRHEIKDLTLPKGDLMMFDNKRVAICTYDQTGRVIQQTFYDENNDITPFLQLKHDLLNRAQLFQVDGVFS